ncbi:MAG: TetR/AcrR family transcriptional regulator, transcriptional repressor for nem operon [Mycobacterium sp.]|jgi:TetR/AcrR family transcriptional repressor of nem operon|nr:TetR/AcrR family transcriptional regulator, transcriptional repressor for nem operon [Mycobacterium sp.]MDT5198501.1 TetR/AcrR family transcriptional regulator, transcriptional repressor for nem operon [Mycobacterium sp.]MDT5346010.1 TetR/AcrR family transcriptional regulator, transcriptional repressor for nem operon [Mycobacterium sp.]
MSVSSAESARALPVTERGRRARASIIDAAATLMYQKGVSTTSLDDVLAAAGSGKSQLYHYFDGKADLVAAVIERQLELVLASQPRLTHIESWDGIDAWVADILTAHSAPGGPFSCPLGTMAGELKNDETFRPLLDDAFRRWEAPLARGLQTMQDRGQLVADADPRRLASTVIAALQGGMLVARVRGDIAPLRDTLEGAVAQLRQWQATTSGRRRSTGTAVDKTRTAVRQQTPKTPTRTRSAGTGRNGSAKTARRGRTTRG